MTHPSRSPVAVYTVTLLVLVATAGAMLAGVGGVAAAQDASLTCVGSGGGPPYQTDSGLKVFQNDTDAVIGGFYSPDNETFRFGFLTDGVNLSAGGADARLENGTGPTTCLGDVNASQHDITVAPDGESGLTVAGEYAGLSFREPKFSDSADGEVDLAYEATSPTAVTVTDTGLAADETVIAVDTSDGSELDSGTVGSDGSVTSDGLPTGSHAVDLRVQEPANYSVTITDTNGPVAADEDVVVEATIENVGEAQGNQKVRFGVDGTSQATRTLSLNGSGNRHQDVQVCDQQQ